MTPLPPALDLHGIANHLGIGFFRVRQWNERERLPAPDISDIRRKRLWSPALIEAWATRRGLWPPGADQYECAVCHGSFCVYETGMIYLHMAHSRACPGGGQLPALHHSPAAAA